MRDADICLGSVTVWIYLLMWSSSLLQNFFKRSKLKSHTMTYEEVVGSKYLINLQKSSNDMPWFPHTNINVKTVSAKFSFLRLIIDIPLTSKFLIIAIWSCHPLTKLKHFFAMLLRLILKSFYELSILAVDPNDFIWVSLSPITLLFKTLSSLTKSFTFPPNDRTFRIRISISWK